MRLTEILDEIQNINETYKNFIGTDPDTLSAKEKWADKVWDMLQQSYAAIGGIKGSGFSSKQDMIKNIPFWKLNVKGDKLIVVYMYKDKNGRKLVAMGTDGSDKAKKIVTRDLKHELKRSFGEKSSAALGFMIKKIPFDVLNQYLLTPKQASRILGYDVIPIKDFNISDLDKNDQFTYKKFGELIKPYMYVRELGGKPKLKVMYGTPGMSIRS